MGAAGSTTVDFGAFPGKSDTSAAVTGQTGIVSGSLVEAWLQYKDSADHLADEHLVDGPVIRAGNIVAGTGFTIYAVARDGIPEPDAMGRRGGRNEVTQVDNRQERGRAAGRPYGLWNVAWVWN